MKLDFRHFFTECILVTTLIMGLWFTNAAHSHAQNIADNATGSIQLTPTEKAWIDKHPAISIAGPRSFPPFHYYEKGKLKGLSAGFSTVEAVRLTIEDTGTGIDPAIQDRIFDPYFTTKEVGKGSGMGLAIVHGIIHNHGGVISVKSEMGCGSVFTVLLPASPTPPADEVSSDTGPVPGGTENLKLTQTRRIPD